jgi:A/G-specific adenine glycosylase
VIESDGFILVRENSPGQIMADLCEFPYFEKKKTLFAIREAARQLCGVKPELIRTLSSVQHTFTRYSATLYPFHFRVKARKEISGHQWISIEQLKLRPFSSGHRRIMYQL